MRDAMRRRLVVAAIAGVLCATVATLRAAPPQQAAAANSAPGLIIGVAAWCHFCQELKQRMATDQQIQPLLRQFRIIFVNLDDKRQAQEFVRRYGLKELSVPILVVTAPSGNPVAMSPGALVGNDLPQFLTESLQTIAAGAGRGPGPALAGATQRPGGQKPAEAKRNSKSPRLADAKDAHPKETPAKDPQAEERLAVLHEARKLLNQGKTAEAVAAIAPFAAENPSGPLKGFITALERKGRTAISGARNEVGQPDRMTVGAMALVKARRLYGGLPALNSDFSAALKELAKAPSGGETLRQAEAIDKGRALDESGQKVPAVEAYRHVVADFANTPVALMAAARLKQLAPQ